MRLMNSFASPAATTITRRSLFASSSSAASSSIASSFLHRSYSTLAQRLTVSSHRILRVTPNAVSSSAANAIAASPSIASSSALSSSSLLPLTSSLVASSSLFYLPIRHATKKAGGSSKNSQDSIGKRLGLKKAAGQHVEIGHILVRQRGKKVHPGRNVGMGRDQTLFALKPGIVCFSYVHTPYHVRKRERKYIHVLTDGMTREQIDAESEVKSKEMQRLVALHKKGIWLPSQREQVLRARRNKANQAKLDAGREELTQIEKDSTHELHAKLMAHPMIKLRADAAAAKAARAAAIAKRDARVQERANTPEAQLA